MALWDFTQRFEETKALESGLVSTNVSKSRSQNLPDPWRTRMTPDEEVSPCTYFHVFAACTRSFVR